MQLTEKTFYNFQILVRDAKKMFGFYCFLNGFFIWKLQNYLNFISVTQIIPSCNID